MLRDGRGLWNMTVNIVIDGENPFASKRWTQSLPGTSSVKSRNTHIMGFWGGELGTVVPDIAQNPRSHSGSQIQEELHKLGSVFDFEACCRDLGMLHEAGMLDRA